MKYAFNGKTLFQHFASEKLLNPYLNFTTLQKQIIIMRNYYFDNKVFVGII